MTSSKLALAGLTAFATIAGSAQAHAGATQWCGGSGGNHTLTLSCPSGKLIVGVGGKGATYLDDVDIMCGTPNANGLFAASGVWKNGPKHLLAEGSDICTGGQAAIGLSTQAQLYVDRIHSAYCSACSGGACHDPFMSTFTINAGGGNDEAGKRCELDCPAGQGAYSIEIRYGAWIDAIRLHCRKP
jgi:hypothetical protein